MHLMLDSGNHTVAMLNNRQYYHSQAASLIDLISNTQLASSRTNLPTRRPGKSYFGLMGHRKYVGALKLGQ